MRHAIEKCLLTHQLAESGTEVGPRVASLNKESGMLVRGGGEMRRNRSRIATDLVDAKVSKERAVSEEKRGRYSWLNDACLLGKESR